MESDRVIFSLFNVMLVQSLMSYVITDYYVRCVKDEINGEQNPSFIIAQCWPNDVGSGSPKKGPIRPLPEGLGRLELGYIFSRSISCQRCCSVSRKGA